MITLDFAPGCNAKKTEHHELQDFEAFFRFYMENNDKGIIFNVKEVDKSGLSQEGKQI